MKLQVLAATAAVDKMEFSGRMGLFFLGDAGGSLVSFLAPFNMEKWHRILDEAQSW